MSKIVTYLSMALEGLEKYIAENKLIILFLIVLLAVWLMKLAGEKTNRLLMYSLLMTVCLICPITAMVVLIYQTAYYDYQWAFSMVPVTIVSAFGLAVLFRDKVQKGKQYLVTFVAVLVVLVLCGNQGSLQKASEEDVAAIAHTESILESISTMADKRECIVWAPQKIMQQMRRLDGEILLLYGRDMWDSKAGSYDYEPYPDAYTYAYKWLEDVTYYGELAASLNKTLEEYIDWLVTIGLTEDAKTHFGTIIQSKVNVIVLPGNVGAWAKDMLLELATEENREIKELYTEKYTIYLLD